MYKADDTEGWSRVRREDLRDFVIRCMEAVGSRTEHAESLAEVLVMADYRGHYSHGLNRLEMYAVGMDYGHMVRDAEPKIIKETAATAWVDGQNLLGPVVGKFCMDLAIDKAKKSGIGWVAAKKSNHYGIAGYYTTRAASHGLIGISMTNTSPVVMPTRSKQRALGTNALSVAAPAQDGDSFVLDMATSTVSHGKVEIAHVKKLSVPHGWVCDSDGKETHDPEAVFAGGGLLPLGGTEETGGYKGYGLSMMVEVFCGILSGAQYGKHVRFLMDQKREPTTADLGQCFVAIDPNAFAPGFEDRMSDLNNTCRNLEPAGEAPVLVAGDPEREHMKKCDQMGAILYHPNQIKLAMELAKKLKTEPIKIIS